MQGAISLAPGVCAKPAGPFRNAHGRCRLLVYTSDTLFQRKKSCYTQLSPRSSEQQDREPSGKTALSVILACIMSMAPGGDAFSDRLLFA
jgi:hypothetical protein